MSLRLAIVGAGPSAFYCAHRVLSRVPAAVVHLYDRLWAPHGLVRYGVAPDHPEVKNCTHKFDETAQNPQFKFFGNVSLSERVPLANSLSIPLSSLFPHYTHLILAHGAGQSVQLTNLDPLHIHPTPTIHHYAYDFNWSWKCLSDVARLLLSDPDKLSPLDIPLHVIDQLKSSSIWHIDIVSRRGPLQLRELLNLPGASMDSIPPTLFPDLSSPGLSRQQSRILALLAKGSKNPPRSTPKTFSIRFLRSPRSSSSLDRTITYDLNTLDAHDRAQTTGESEMQRTDLIVTSLGYRSDHGWYDPSLGRSVRRIGALVKNVYTSGWAANGARGVLASTMYDAYSVADTLVADYVSGEAGAGGATAAGNPGTISVRLRRTGVPSFLREVSIQQGKRIVQYEQWKMIDEEETRRGQRIGKERERMRWEEVQEFLAQKSVQ
ncbi:hypothetical protein BS47DRAFT_1436437 [Hydnum rufescens UP504]|uniref:NADPH:adrenodoxin oxidoreductase, mitochondrial n=1 Tax=Hydnum rufescens UP504 TaxID=1448309 RepID=A0A9P6AG52_9AGAM|nr:hypothetical protein BS47DRAFT_1436437 [Hydnum rufescens UP504]